MLEQQRKVVLTGDGSHTVISAGGLSYHSMRGAIRESRHVCLEMGLAPAMERFKGALSVLEIGFGTGLNAMLTSIEAERTERTISYYSLEPFP